jgi:hypothetical protein
LELQLLEKSVRLSVISATNHQWGMKQAKNATSCRNACTSTSCASKKPPLMEFFFIHYHDFCKGRL